MGVELTRAVAERASRDLPCGERRWKPRHWSLVNNGLDLRVKDVRYSRRLYRYTIGRFLLGREYRIYKKLEGLPFVPRCLGRLDRDAIVLENIEAVGLQQAARSGLDPRFFDRLVDCVRALHERGVVHMDMRHRANILVTPDQRPVFVDFESAIYLGPWRPLRRLLVPWFAWLDRSALLKYRLRYFPDRASLTDSRTQRRFLALRRLWRFGRLWPPRVGRRPGPAGSTSPGRSG